MIARTFKTALLDEGHAYDIDMPTNDFDKSRVIFSFDTAESRDAFLRDLESRMVKHGCWAGLEIEKGGDR